MAPAVGPVEKATRREVAALVKRESSLKDESALVALAMSLAKRIDDSRTSPTAVSMLAGQWRETMAELRALAPPAQKSDDVADLAEQRRKRLASAAAARAAGGVDRSG